MPSLLNTLIEAFLPSAHAMSPEEYKAQLEKQQPKSTYMTPEDQKRLDVDPNVWKKSISGITNIPPWYTSNIKKVKLHDTYIPNRPKNALGSVDLSKKPYTIDMRRSFNTQMESTPYHEVAHTRIHDLDPNVISIIHEALAEELAPMMQSGELKRMESGETEFVRDRINQYREAVEIIRELVAKEAKK